MANVLLDPVLLCNDLGQIGDFTREASISTTIKSDGHTSMSIKEAARIAQSNNFMGLICRSSLLVRQNIPFLSSREMTNFYIERHASSH